MTDILKLIETPATLETRRRQYHDGSLDEIPLISAEVDYIHFFRHHLVHNRPCVFGPWITTGWRCRRDWLTVEGHVDFCRLEQDFGSALVPVANCRSRKYDAQVKTEWKFSDYLCYLESFREGGGSDILYCKDWHLAKDFPQNEPYQTPVFFQSDWLNQYYDSLEYDDYRFVYVGPSSSWTPFHADVLRSYSWSANIVGGKKWLLFPRGSEEKLRSLTGQLPFEVEESDTDCLVVHQNPGETIFVPSGWFHQVHNQRSSGPVNSNVTISANHNWLNGCNVDLAWEHLQKSMIDVQNAISDCADMDGYAAQCQLILKANEGFDYADFFRFLKTIADPLLFGFNDVKAKRKELMSEVESIEATSQPSSSSNFSQPIFKPNSALHQAFDLSRIGHCLRLMSRDSEALEGLAAEIGVIGDDCSSEGLLRDVENMVESIFDYG